MGIGAFNLLRRKAYEAAGTHVAVSLRPDEDLRFGWRVKRLGLRQRLLIGDDLLSVEWYPSLGAAVRGLEKNAFAGLDYSLLALLGSQAFAWGLLVAPYFAVWRARGAARWLLLAGIAAQLANFAYATRYSGPRTVRHTPALPALAALLSYATLRSAWLALRRGGVRWRGTTYPLGELRAQTGLEGTPGPRLPWFPAG